jgi:hypothetical protein
MVFGLALVVGVGIMALAAVSGDPLKLGQAHLHRCPDPVDRRHQQPHAQDRQQLHQRFGDGVGAAGRAGQGPHGGRLGTKAANLNADDVDGEGADEIGVNRWERIEATSAFNSQSPKSATARFLSGNPPYPRRGRKGQES